MKLAYLITAADDPAQLRRLVSALHTDAEFYIHVDADADIAPFMENMSVPNIHFTDVREHVKSNNFSAVRAQMLLVADCVNSGVNFDYVFFLSSADYPLWHCDRITEFLYDNRGREYLTAICLASPEVGNSFTKDYRQMRPDIDIPFLGDAARDRINKASRKLLSAAGLHKSLQFKVSRSMWKLYRGGSAWCISGKLLNLVFGHYERHKEIHSYFSNQLRPIETVVPTIAFNTPHAKCCTLHIGNFTSMSDLMPLHFMVASQSGYKILDERNYHKIVSSGMMFVRGVNSSSSSMLLNMIDKYRAASAPVD